MYTKEYQDIRSLPLKWLQPFIFILLVIVFVLVFRINPSGSYERVAYSLLIGSLALINGLAYGATLKHNYRLSSLLTVGLSLIGCWGAIYIDARLGLTEFFPLIYVTITVLLSSVLLSLPFTIFIAFTQFVTLLALVFRSPALMAYNWPSFISYVLIISVIGIVANYISSYQLKLFKESSIRDHLTGLLNRRYFDVTLEDKVQRGGSRGYTYGIMMMDIDNFKGYNDKYSHASGDMILQRVAEFLTDTLERHAIICRYGGDEFAIIIPDTNQPELFSIAQHLITEVKKVDITDICKTRELLSISIGLALFPENGDSADALMAHADRNLMMAKELGKDRVIS